MSPILCCVSCARLYEKPFTFAQVLRYFFISNDTESFLDFSP